MSWLKKQAFGTHVVVAVTAGFMFGVSAEVLADTVYTWTTESGTVAYTDDEKHIPARYRDRAEVKVMDSLEGYSRFTPIDTEAYAGELTESGETVARASQPGAVRRPAGAGLAVISGGSRYGNNGVVIPVNERGGDDAPLIIENRRVKPGDSMATTHETVGRRGGKVIWIRRDEKNQRDGSGMVPPVDD